MSLSAQLRTWINFCNRVKPSLLRQIEEGVPVVPGGPGRPAVEVEPCCGLGIARTQPWRPELSRWRIVSFPSPRCVRVLRDMNIFRSRKTSDDKEIGRQDSYHGGCATNPS